MYQKIKLNDLNNLDNFLLIDVKSNQEFINDHLPNAINIPLNKILDIINIEPDRNRVIIVYCKEGKRSYKACISLINLGYKNVYDLKLT